MCCDDDNDCGECCGMCDCCGHYTTFCSLFWFFGLLLMVILLPLSLKRIDFDEIGIKYDGISREMSSEAMGEGLHDVTPSGSFILFKRTQRSITFNDIACLSQDAITVSVDLQVLFTVQRAHLRSLIDDFYDQDGHESFLSSLCLSVVRDVASTFVIRQFYLERQNVQTSIQTTLRNKFESLNARADVESVQVSDIRLPSTVSRSLLRTTTSQQDIQNAQSERATQVQAAEIRQRLAGQQAQLTLINAGRDVSVINQAAEQERQSETSKLVQRTDSFGNISEVLGKGGDFFVQAYLRYLVMRQNGHETTIGLP